MEVRDDGKSNPLIIVSPEDVLEWLREKADRAGYPDRQSLDVQISVETKFSPTGAKLHHETPTLVFMVSNIKNSRSPAPRHEQNVSNGETK